MRSQVVNGFQVLSYVREFGNAEVTSPIVFRRQDSDEPFGVLCGYTSEKQGVNNAEDGHIGRNPESRCQHRDDGESWRFAQNARCEAQILPTRRHKRFPAGRTDNFLCNFETPPLQADGAKRILAAHPMLHLFLSCHFEEVAQFFVQLSFDEFVSEQRSESARYSS